MVYTVTTALYRANFRHYIGTSLHSFITDVIIYFHSQNTELVYNGETYK
jgi:hypothetical protein